MKTAKEIINTFPIQDPIQVENWHYDKINNKRVYENTILMSDALGAMKEYGELLIRETVRQCVEKVREIKIDGKNLAIKNDYFDSLTNEMIKEL